MQRKMWTWWSAPHFTCLHEVGRMAGDSAVIAGAQNFYYEDSGAYTGEVSAPMLLDVEAGAVIVGHSERREVFGETDEMVARKTKRAVEADILPIVCVGETKEERDAGGMWEKVSGQVERVIEELEDVGGESVVFAYEPIWAIGTGDTATPEDAQDAIGRIRDLLREKEETTSQRASVSSTAAPSSRRTRPRSWPRKTSTAPW